MYELYEKQLEILRNTTRYRKLPSTRQVNRNNKLDFSTNDYLGFSQHPEILEAGLIAAKKYGVGSTGSRLLSGNSDLFEEFESQIAQDKSTETALIFNSGFQANFSVLASLLHQKTLGSKPIVFFDRSNHSSLYQGIFLAKPELVRYSHNNMKQLESLLLQHRDDPRPKFIVTETIFGMDGDISPLEAIVTLARSYGTFLYLDEAHATGVLGKNGYGLSSTINFANIPHIIMGTFSKALGCSGGYIACNQILRDYLINTTPGFIYSTSLSPFIIGAAFKAWQMVAITSSQRNHLRTLSDKLRIMLLDLNFDIGLSNSHIIPIILKKEDLAIQFKNQLSEKNILVSAIRHPTVPLNSARLRIALTANHQENQIHIFIQALKEMM